MEVLKKFLGKQGSNSLQPLQPKKENGCTSSSRQCKNFHDRWQDVYLPKLNQIEVIGLV